MKQSIVGIRTAFMVVKIRFGRGPVVTRRQGKNSRIAMLGGSMLTLVSICLCSLGMWRLSEDVGLAGDFIVTDGFLSHWQVWIGSAVITQYGCWRLTRYANRARESAADEAEQQSARDVPDTRSVAANV